MTIRDLKETMMIITRVEIYSERCGMIGAVLLGKADESLLDLRVDTLVPVDRETILVMVQDDESEEFIDDNSKQTQAAAPEVEYPAVVDRKSHPLRDFAGMLRVGVQMARRARSRRGIFARPDMRMLGDLQSR